MADANSKQTFPVWPNGSLAKARGAARSYLLDFAADESVVRDAEDMLSALARLPLPDPDPVVRSRLSMIINHHIWQYWYYEGIPLVVRVAYWAAVEAGLFPLPNKFAPRWSDFNAHMQEIKARETALRRSDMAGGWLFSGEPQVLWEIARLAAKISGDFCELGAWTGRSATILCAAVRHFAPHKRVLLVDNWEWGLEADSYPFMTEGRSALIELERQLEPYAGAFLPIKGLLLEKIDAVKASIRAGGLALLHHDAGHDFSHVIKDLDAYLPLLVEGGYLVVHDYNHPGNPDTKKAVDEVVHRHAPSLHRMTIFNTIGLFRKGPSSSLCAGDGLSSLGTSYDVSGAKEP